MTQDSSKLTHLDEHGRIRMVDVGGKPLLRRQACAEGFLCGSAQTLDRLQTGELPKGEALAAARIAGIQAAKRCDELNPLAHPLPLEVVAVDFDRDEPTRLRIEATVSTTAKTGVEMEALTAVSIAALALYDMAKAVDKSLRIEGIRLVSKKKEAISDQ